MSTTKQYSFADLKRLLNPAWDGSAPGLGRVAATDSPTKSAVPVPAGNNCKSGRSFTKNRTLGTLGTGNPKSLRAWEKNSPYYIKDWPEPVPPVPNDNALSISAVTAPPAYLPITQPPPLEYRDATFAICAAIEPTHRTDTDAHHGERTTTTHAALVTPAIGWTPTEPMRWDDDAGAYLFC